MFGLMGGTIPSHLLRNLTKRINSIPPQALWSGRHTRSGIHSKDTPPHKGGPHNSTGSTQAPSSLGTPTSPIPTDQEIHRDIIQGVLDDPKIPKSLLGTAWEEELKIFSALTRLTIYSLANKCHNLPQIVLIPTTWVQLSPQVSIPPTWVQHNLHIVPITNHKSTTLGSNKDSNPQQIDIKMVMDHVKSLENRIKQESEQLEINKVKHESDLRNMSQQYETQINKLIHTQ